MPNTEQMETIVSHIRIFSLSGKPGMNAKLTVCVCVFACMRVPCVSLIRMALLIMEVSFVGERKGNITERISQ